MGWLAILTRYWYVIAIPLILGATYAYAHHAGSAGRQPEIDSLAAQIRNDREAIKRERDEWTAKIDGISASAASDSRRIQVDYENRLGSANAAERIALERMRKSDAALRASAALKPAESAPVECKQYESSPTLLPERDRELLVRLGAAADRIVLERNACVEQYQALERLLGDSPQ